ncbi:hypothetical protein SADUNF_Sadunf03G0126200 [Salix dunnii]|uniref:DUF7788 domain-containing protein n=1 Tax=Salix dunnii TaxID=1413687 RepID=A0A835TEK6_9ROSI|nr:hypothetical protein SADUNF_Sadunf03G0126200 [Salix dunnii]
MQKRKTISATNNLRADSVFKGKLITFNANPTLQMVERDSLLQKTEFVRHMDWGMNTNLQKVFDLILQVGVNGDWRGDQMLKRVFVFSDMGLDQVSFNHRVTDHQRFRATLVPGTQKGVALVNGFSKNMTTLITIALYFTIQ